jgi:hypothetical protein
LALNRLEKNFHTLIGKTGEPGGESATYEHEILLLNLGVQITSNPLNIFFGDNLSNKSYAKKYDFVSYLTKNIWF